MENTEYLLSVALKEKWYRYERDGHRFYHNRKKVLAGITTILKEVMPTPPAIIKYLEKNGEEELQRTADFGSLLHLLILRYMKVEHWWLSIPPGENKESDLWRSMIAYRNFEQDYFAGITPYMLEVPLHGKVAGCEYVCTIDFCSPMAITTYSEVEGEEVYKSGAKKGQKKMIKVAETKTINVIVDFKSNYYDKDKSFYQAQLFQLLAQKEAVSQQTGIKVDKIFNWTPTGFRKDNGHNTYKLVEWVLEGEETPKDWSYKTYTKSDVRQFELYMKLAKERGVNIPRGTITKFLPFLRGEDSPSTQEISYADYIRGK